jgi:hypothetical protein
MLSWRLATYHSLTHSLCLFCNHIKMSSATQSGIIIQTMQINVLHLVIISLDHWMVSPVYFCLWSYYWYISRLLLISHGYYWYISRLINPNVLLRSSLIGETLHNIVFACTYFIQIYHVWEGYCRETKNFPSRMAREI